MIRSYPGKRILNDYHRIIVVYNTVLCSNEGCKPGSFRCDGSNDCSDGSDELNYGKRM